MARGVAAPGSLSRSGWSECSISAPGTGIYESAIARDSGCRFLSNLFSGPRRGGAGAGAGHPLNGSIPAVHAERRFSGSASRPRNSECWNDSKRGGLLATRINPTSLPAWISETEANVYVEQFSKSGYRGGLSWYRNIDRNRELLSAFNGLKIIIPALYAAGDRDVVLAFQGMDSAIAALPQTVPLLQRTVLLPGCGHWTQQERPNEVNAALLEFLKTIV